jgi:hypothetical protein
MENMTWGDNPYFSASMSMEECGSSCLEDCNCGAALFDGHYCQKQKLPLRHVRRDKDGYKALLKVGHTKPYPKEAIHHDNKQNRNGTNELKRATNLKASKMILCWVRVLLEQYTKVLYTKVKNLLQ